MKATPKVKRPFSFRVTVSALERRGAVKKAAAFLKEAHERLYEGVEVSVLEGVGMGASVIHGDCGPLRDPWESLEYISGRFSPIDQLIERWMKDADRDRQGFITAYTSITPYKRHVMFMDVALKYDPMARTQGAIQTLVQIDGAEVLNFACPVVEAIQYREMYEKIWCTTLPPLPTPPKRPPSVNIAKSDLDDLIARAARAPVEIPLHERYRPHFFD